MPEGDRHLTCAERCQIHALRKSGLSGPAIARQLGRDRTTVWPATPARAATATGRRRARRRRAAARPRRWPGR